MKPLGGQRWFVGASVLEPGRGGIARVARLCLRSLSDAGADLSGVSLLDAAPQTVGEVHVPGLNGSRARFAARCHMAALRRGGMLYDSVGLARAHPRLGAVRRPYGLWIHGIEVWHGLSPARARALKGAAFVLANSQFTLERFRSIHGPLPTALVCPLATEEDTLPELSAAPPHPPTVLILGRLDARAGLYKGHRDLIRAWPEVLTAVPEARLLIVGSGDGAETVAGWVRASPAAHRIEMRGFVPEAGMPDIWAQSDVFAMPSRGEGFGLVYAEAMRHGLPVIASRHDAGAEVNRHGDTGFTVDLDRPGDLTGALTSLLGDPALRRRQGAAARARWQAEYRYSAFRERFIALLSARHRTNRLRA